MSILRLFFVSRFENILNPLGDIAAESVDILRHEIVVIQALDEAREHTIAPFF